jgi:hypothetical protein
VPVAITVAADCSHQKDLRPAVSTAEANCLEAPGRNGALPGAWRLMLAIQRSAFRRTLASFKSGVSKPSLNQL